MEDGENSATFRVRVLDLNEDGYCLSFNVKDFINKNIIFNNKLTFDIHSEKDNILMCGTLNFGLDNSKEITLLEYLVDFMQNNKKQIFISIKE